jgi:hypothetical protein
MTDIKYSTKLPSNVPPQIGMWGIPQLTIDEPEGYKQSIDVLAEHAPYNLLTAAARLPAGGILRDETHRFIKEAVAYAKERDMRVVLDLCVRLAREPFRQRYPEEMQELLKIAEVRLDSADETVCRLASEATKEHYTSSLGVTPYIPLAGRLERVYRYSEADGEVIPESVRDITAQCRVLTATEREVAVSIPRGRTGEGEKARVLVVFTHLSADVFSPHLLAYQRELIQRYAGIGLSGAMKDEWGFMAQVEGADKGMEMECHQEFFYSRAYAKAYAEAAGGRDLVADMFLMSVPHRGKHSERQRAINHYFWLNYRRNVEIEEDFYRATKEILGASAFVASHPTWYPQPHPGECFHNGLNWWAVRRDMAQTDEVCNFPIRTALAKKWNSPLWYNQFYSDSVDHYVRNAWRCVLAGGRQNYHQLHSPHMPSLKVVGKEWLAAVLARYTALMRPDLLEAESRIRLLNFISKSSLDCRAAVVFGHSAAMNWAGPYYKDYGVKAAEGIWREGYPTDLIPTSEIYSGALTIGADGYAWYGPQRYDAILLVNPEFERRETASFFQAVARGGKTALFQIGQWSRDFDANPVGDDLRLPRMRAGSIADVVAELRKRGVQTQAPLSEPQEWPYVFDPSGKNSPPRTGTARMIDGTWIHIAATANPTGDPILGEFDVDGHKVHVDAIGVVGLRLTPQGQLEALAAAQLRRLQVGECRIELETPTDMALWQDEAGHWHGVLQDHPGSVPSSLQAFTDDWLRIRTPRGYSKNAADGLRHISDDKDGK